MLFENLLEKSADNMLLSNEIDVETWSFFKNWCDESRYSRPQNFNPAPKKPYKEVEVAPWYGKAKNMGRAVNDYLAKQIQRHYEIVKKDFNFNGTLTIITKNKKSRVKETKKFYAR
ncbi:MAG: hypothetical protein IJT73_08195 [Selenomonadaceae bacterium]|nr:hypothetical protein [Selenomonadaceae bacterium]